MSKIETISEVAKAMLDSEPEVESFPQGHLLALAENYQGIVKDMKDLSSQLDDLRDAKNSVIRDMCEYFEGTKTTEAAVNGVRYTYYPDKKYSVLVKDRNDAAAFLNSIGQAHITRITAAVSENNTTFQELREVLEEAEVSAELVYSFDTVKLKQFFEKEHKGDLPEPFQCYEKPGIKVKKL